MAVSMVGPPKTDCPRVREKVIWESLYPILGSIRPHGLGLRLKEGFFGGRPQSAVRGTNGKGGGGGASRGKL
jgi:hypothetical protein